MKQEDNSLLIYVPKMTHRIRYVFSLFFVFILKLDFSLTSDAEKFRKWEGAKMSYGKQPLGSEPFLAAVDLLFERGIRHVDIQFLKPPEDFAFFPVYHKASLYPFDLLAASFYLVSRYEEYLPYKKDLYGRFGVKQSLAYRKKFLHKPLVNIWALRLASDLEKLFPGLRIERSTYRFQSTIDIDAAWAFSHKGLMRTLGGYAKDLRSLRFKQVAYRTRVLLGKEKDPYDTYSFMYRIHQRFRLRPLYFILFAKYGHNDKNTPTGNHQFRELIKSLADHADIGIHPSFNANSEPGRLSREIDALEKVLNREIKHSRQHFLRLELPATYRHLMQEEIYRDYTMGYAARPGFRASIATPFPFFDLDLDVMTKLMVYPFPVMDASLRYYLGLKPEQALRVYKQYIDEIKNAGGTFISLWHNESLSDLGEWKHWREVFVKMLEMAVAGNGKRENNSGK